MEDKPFTSGIIGDPTETGTAELYVLCEGLFNQNNSSLARFSFGNQQMVRDYFKAVIFVKSDVAWLTGTSVFCQHLNLFQ